MNHYTYKISIFTKDQNCPVHNEMIFSFADPLIARSLAIQELKRILDVADKQLTGAAPYNPYGIPEWDNPSLIREIPEMNSTLTPLTVELILDLGGTEYILHGAGVQETIEALSAEARQLMIDGLIDDLLLIGLLENTEWEYDYKDDEHPYLFTDHLNELPDFSFIQHSILKEHAEFLLTGK